MLIALLVACAAPQEGVWWVALSMEEEASCAQTVAHNFLDASVPETEDPEDAWERIGQTWESPAGFYVLVTQGPDGLVWTGPDTVYLGDVEDGAWTLQHYAYEGESALDSHPSGYHFQQEGERSVTRTLDLTQAGQVLEGNLTISTVDSARYSEVEGWGEELGQSSQLPASSYLEGPEGAVVANTREGLECVDDPCVLQVEAQCSWSGGVVAQLTGLSAEAFDGVLDAGFDAGE
ncbi:MAG: hypothetical protein VX899_06510 [Myxococcota bacterium]|nr:hypothetical protein [Myxococcota bacterium]